MLNPTPCTMKSYQHAAIHGLEAPPNHIWSSASHPDTVYFIQSAADGRRSPLNDPKICYLKNMGFGGAYSNFLANCLAE